MSKELIFKYKFQFENGTEKKFQVTVDADTLTIIRKAENKVTEWAKLKNFKCMHCPLDETKVEYCPVAINLIDVIEAFKDFPSYQTAEITVETNVRTYTKKAALQTGVSSYIGIMMVSSGCPVMRKLKPMLNFHLPFATLEETQIRAFSMYLLAQYVKWKKGEHPDWEMNNLSNMYEDIRILNHNVSRHIADLEAKDTSINALVILNNFADYVTFTLDEKVLDELEVFLREFIN